MQNENETSDADLERREQRQKAWNCKPFGPRSLIPHVLVVTAILLVLFTGVIAVGFLAPDRPGGPLLLFAMILALAVVLEGRKSLLRKGRDCLRLDPDHLIRVREGRRYLKMWEVPLAGIREVSFGHKRRGVAGIRATIRGRGFVVREINGLKSREWTAEALRFGPRDFRLHPRLLECLIEMVSEQGVPPTRAGAVEEAKAFATEVAAEPERFVPGAEERIEPDLAAIDRHFQRVRKRYLLLLLLFYGSLLAGLGLLVFCHLRSFYPFLNIAFGVCLLFLPCLLITSSQWIRPIASLPLGRRARIVSRPILEAGFVVCATLMWFFPAVWLVVALYLILLLGSLMNARSGPLAAGLTVAVLLLGLGGYIAGSTAYLGNWQVDRVDRVLAVRYRVASVRGLAVSPDATNLAVGLTEVCPVAGRELGVYAPVRDSLLDFYERATRLILSTAWTGEPATESNLHFAASDGSGPIGVVVPGDLVYHLRWSPDSRRLAFAAYWSGDGFQISLADPLERTLRRVHRSNQGLSLPRDSWTTEGATLRAIARGRGGGPSERLAIDLATGGATTEPSTERTDSLTTVAVSPDRQWVATHRRKAGRSVVQIQPRRQKTPLTTIPIWTTRYFPHLRWSPDSLKLAIIHRLRTWVHDLETGNTTIVKTWRRGRRDHMAWAPDSRSLYYSRYVAVQIIGYEVMRITLPD